MGQILVAYTVLLIPLLCLLCEMFGGVSEGREYRIVNLRPFFIPFAEAE